MVANNKDRMKDYWLSFQHGREGEAACRCSPKLESLRRDRNRGHIFKFYLFVLYFRMIGEMTLPTNLGSTHSITNKRRGLTWLGIWFLGLVQMNWLYVKCLGIKNQPTSWDVCYFCHGNIIVYRPRHFLSDSSFPIFTPYWNLARACFRRHFVRISVSGSPHRT